MKGRGRAVRRYNEQLQKSINWGIGNVIGEEGKKSRVQESSAQTGITCQSCEPSDSEVVDGVLDVD